MPSSCGDSITLRSFAPLPWRTWMTPRALSMSSIRSPATSEALSPAAPIRRFAEIAAELRNRTDVGSLRRRRQITDGHVLDHATAQKAHCGHLETSCLGGGLQHPHPLRQEALHATSPFTPRQRLRSIVNESQLLGFGITPSQASAGSGLRRPPSASAYQESSSSSR